MEAPMVGEDNPVRCGCQHCGFDIGGLCFEV